MGSVKPAGRRQPPPPRRCSESSLMGGVVVHHSNTASKREGNTSMVRRAYYFRRCKKVPASNIESLPNELISEILVRLSADDICENAMVVCRNWYHIIHSGDAFINAHRSNSDCGLLLTSCFVSLDHPLFLAVRQGRIEISYKLYQKCQIQIPASCNGLALWREASKLCTIYIVNLATKQTFSLPPSLPHQVCMGYIGIAYAAASMVYKVVRTYTRLLLEESIQSQCDILTAGVDNNWRSCIGVDNLSCGAKKLLLGVPVITEGFMHWTWKWKGTQVLTLNVETEMFTESYVPLCQKDDEDDHCRGRRIYYLSTGRRLSLLFACGDWMWEVWEMEAESGEWRKLLPNIDLEAQKSRIEQEIANQPRAFIRPLGWVKYPVLLALCFGGGWSQTCIVYNLDTDEIDSIELPRPCRSYRALVHRNTLEWLSFIGNRGLCGKQLHICKNSGGSSSSSSQPSDSAKSQAKKKYSGRHWPLWVPCFCASGVVSNIRAW